MKRTLLALIIVITIASTLVGGTLAGFSDTERSLDNEVEVCDLDIKVAMADDSWNAGVYHDDPDLEPVLEEECAAICQTYGANIFVKNQGRVNGIAALHIRVTEDSEDIADTTEVTIYYDADGNGTPEQITTDPTYLESLDCNPLTLGLLPACGVPRKLRLEIHPQAPGEAAAGFILGLDIEFQLIQEDCPGFTDTEVSWAYLEGCGGEGCTPGGWKNRLLRIGEWDNTVSPDGTPYSPDQPVFSVFIAALLYPPEISHASLLVAISPELWGPGDSELEGAAKTLLKHAVAAVLNAAHPRVDYPMPQEDIIDQVNDALASGSPIIMDDLKDILAGYNELGCDPSS